MGRGEPTPPTPVAPAGIETRADLARALTALRSRSGLTVRELAKRLDMPAATVGDYFSGRHLPGPAQQGLFTAVLRECGVGTDELDGWLDALTRVRLTSDGRVGQVPAPYRGLEPFQTEDAELFFGREAATEDILARLAWLGSADGAGSDSLALLFVIGPSGSGKSSLLRAGVEAQVRAGALDAGGGGRWSTAVITPGDAPVQTLRACVGSSDGERRLIIIDQFEELFGAVGTQQKLFLDELAGSRRPGTVVVAGLRADFYQAAVSEPMLLAALRRTQVLVGPMTEEEVRRAIVEPARCAGVLVEDGVVELLLADLAPGGPTGFAHEAGTLPLLSHALLATWERAQRNRLTIEDYREVGGLRGAVRQSAEELYEQLTPDEQALARQLFCRMVRVGEDAPLTRRRVARHELEELDAAADEDRGDKTTGQGTRGVLDRFVAARLVTADAETVELSHEALLTAWPRLAGWIEQDQVALRMHHQLTDATNAWLVGNRDPSLLLRGSRLQLTADWVEDSDRRAQLNRGEREFLDAGLALAETERRAGRRRTRRMQELLAAVAALAVAGIVLAVVAFQARHTADQARDQALSRQVAIESTDLEPTDPALAMQLALAAYRISPTTEATSTLLDASASEMPTRLLGPIGPTSLGLAANGRWLAVAYADAHELKLFSLSGGLPKLVATVSTGPSSVDVYAVALSPDGRLLAAGGTGKVILWSLVRPADPVRLAVLGGLAGTVYGVSFSADGRRLAAADSDGTVRRWSLAVPSAPVAQPVLDAPSRPSLQAVSYSPDGRTLAAAGANGQLFVWGVGARPRLLATQTAGATTLTSVSYSPDGSTLAAGGQDDLVHLWNLDRAGVPVGRLTPLGGFTSWVDSLAFSPDGRYLAAGDSDLSLRVWSTADWTPVARFQDPAPVTGVGFTPGDQRLLTVDEDGTTRIWSFPPPTSYRTPGSVFSIDYTASGHELAAVSGGPQGDVDLWNVADPWRPTHLAAISVPGAFGPAAGVEALSPDGQLLAVGNAPAKVQMLELERPAHPRPVGPVLGGATPNIEQLNFSPSMRVLSVADDAGRIHMWNVADPADPTALPTLDPDGKSSNIFGVAYSPNGKLLAAAAADDKVWLWDVADPQHPQLLTVLGGFTSYVYADTFTPDGRTLIAGSADNTLRLWNVSDPAHPRLLGHPLTGPTSTVYSIAVSPDGRILAAATTGGQVWLWNIASPAQPVLLAELTAATGQVFEVNFSPNHTTLVASGADQTLTFWDYRTSQVAARMCALAGTPITHAEWGQYVQGATYDPPCR